jgi:hypothetical protein
LNRPIKSEKICAPFKVSKPCSNCPFRKDSQAIDLADGRKEDIIEGLLSGREASFPCHKTVYSSNHKERKSDAWSLCPGAAAVARKFGRDITLIQVASRMNAVSQSFLDASMALTIDPSDLNVDLKKARI